MVATTEKLNILVTFRNAAKTGLGRLKQDLRGVGTSARGAAKGTKALYGSLAAIAGILAGGALLGSAIKTFADFDDNMRAAGAVTGATKDQLDLMTQAAERMGRETRYTAAQSASALRFLGMAGFEAAEATAALPDVLNLAAAGALDLGTAADITTNIMAGFGLEVEQLSRVNDVLVSAFTGANVNLIEIGEAFKFVGPIAKGVGADFEDLIAAIGKLGDAGLKGTIAGTSLKNAIDALLVPTAKEAELMGQLEARMGGVALKIRDSEGDFIGFASIIEQLEKAGLRGEEALQLFGMRAGPGMAALMNQGSIALRKMAEDLRNAEGEAKRIADEMEAGIGGSIRRTISVYESLKIQIGRTFSPEIEEVMVNLRNTMRALAEQFKQLAEDGTIAQWGENTITVINALTWSLGKAAHAASFLIGSYKAAFLAIKGDMAGAQREVDNYVKSINKLFGGIVIFGDGEGAPDDAKTVVGKITQAMYDELEAEAAAAAAGGGPIAKGGKKLGDALAKQIVSVPSLQAEMRAGLMRLGAILKQEATAVESQYAKKLISLDEYYSERARIIEAKTVAELEVLRTKESRERDVSKKEILQAQIFVKEKELQTALLALSQERFDEEKNLDKKKIAEIDKLNRLKLKAEKAFRDQKLRIREEGKTLFEAELEKESAALQTRHINELLVVNKYHQEVLQALRDRGATELEIFQATEDQKAAILQQKQLQQQEQDQLQITQMMKVSEYRLNNFKTIASGMSDIFSSLYEMTGKQSKELFYLAKAAAVAEATINIAQGVTKALAQGGIFGIATGALVAAAGAVQIGMILSQGLAEGGEVQGSSPHSKADNIGIRATAGEFMQPVAAVSDFGKSFMELIRTSAPTETIMGALLQRKKGGNGLAYTTPTSIAVGKGGAYADGGAIKSGNSAYGSGAGGKEEKQSFNIINVVDPKMLEQFNVSNPGQRSIVNAIGANIFEIRQMVFNNQG